MRGRQSDSLQFEPWKSKDRQPGILLMLATYEINNKSSGPLGSGYRHLAVLGGKMRSESDNPIPIGLK